MKRGLIVGRDVLTPGVMGDPGGEWISLQLTRDNVQLINLYTDQRVMISGYLEAWLEDDLAWIQRPGEGVFLFRPSLQTEVPLLPLQTARPDLYQDRDFTPALVEALKAAQTVFIIDFLSSQKIVVLDPDYWQHPEQNFFINIASDLSDLVAPERQIESLLSKHGIPYQVIFASYNSPPKPESPSVLSPRGHFIAKGDGVYDSSTMEKIIDYGMPSLMYQLSTVNGNFFYGDFWPYYWRSDEKVLILAIADHPGQALRSFWLTTDITAFGLSFIVPLPVLKVTLPDELFDPAPTPTP